MPVSGYNRTIHRVPREELHQEVAQLSQEEQEYFIRLFVGVPFPPNDATILADHAANSEEIADDEGPFDDFWTSPASPFYFRV